MWENPVHSPSALIYHRAMQSNLLVGERVLKKTDAVVDDAARSG